MPAPQKCMDGNPSLALGSTPVCSLLERRGAQRIATPFLVTVRGVDRSGDRFRMNTVLDNLSATGLHLRLIQSIELGALIFVVVRFSTMPAYEVAAPGVAARGVVVRVEPRPGGFWGVAMKFTRQRFLYANITCSSNHC